jgi:hypothetical protein
LDDLSPLRSSSDGFPRLRRTLQYHSFIRSEFLEDFGSFARLVERPLFDASLTNDEGDDHVVSKKKNLSFSDRFCLKPLWSAGR